VYALTSFVIQQFKAVWYGSCITQRRSSPRKLYLSVSGPLTVLRLLIHTDTRRHEVLYGNGPIHSVACISIDVGRRCVYDFHFLFEIVFSMSISTIQKRAGCTRSRLVYVNTIILPRNVKIYIPDIFISESTGCRVIRQEYH
jgi:hypothetical protein